MALDSNLVKENYYINQIDDRNIREFTMSALEQYGSVEKLKVSSKVADVVLGLLEKKKLLNPGIKQTFVDVLISASLIHNLFFLQDNWITLFEARQKLEPLAEAYNLDSQITSCIFQTVEAQLGEDTPVPNCKPINNTPTELFAYAVWFVKEYRPLTDKVLN